MSERVRCLIFAKQQRPKILLVLALAAVAACLAGSGAFAAQEPPPEDSQDQGPPPGEEQGPYTKLSKDQLERLVAPIALYPDSLVGQVLSASTFPSQIADAEEFMKSHPGLKAEDLGKEANEQPWDNSVKALVQFPNVLANLASNLGWTSELGDAYYNQQQDVMKAVQEMRKKAKKAGNLKSSQQENVQEDDGQIQIEPSEPNVVYVPAYDPWIVYGYPIAPWPYWVETPGIWFGGPGLYFGIGFPLSPFFGFGWGWGAWGVDWYRHGVYFNHEAYFHHGGDVFDRRGYYGGRGDYGRAGAFRGGERGGDRGGNFHGGGSNRGFQEEHGNTGTRSGAFSGYNHGGMSRGFSARGQSSMGGGGFHGGGFGGGGFHGGGGGGHR